MTAYGIIFVIRKNKREYLFAHDGIYWRLPQVDNDNASNHTEEVCAQGLKSLFGFEVDTSYSHITKLFTLGSHYLPFTYQVVLVDVHYEALVKRHASLFNHAWSSSNRGFDMPNLYVSIISNVEQTLSLMELNDNNEENPHITI